MRPAESHKSLQINCIGVFCQNCQFTNLRFNSSFYHAKRAARLRKTAGVSIAMDFPLLVLYNYTGQNVNPHDLKGQDRVHSLTDSALQTGHNLLLIQTSHSSQDTDWWRPEVELILPRIYSSKPEEHER